MTIDWREVGNGFLHWLVTLAIIGPAHGPVFGWAITASVPRREQVAILLLAGDDGWKSSNMD